MDAEDRAARGRRAAQEFRELERAFQMVGDRWNAELLAAEPGSPVAIQRHHSIRSLGEVRKALLAIVQDGEMATLSGG